MGEWQNGLCGCFNDCGLCILTYFCPCVTVGKNAEAMGSGSCCLYGCLFFLPIVNLVVRAGQRGRVRDMRQIEGGMCGDCLCVIFCPFCSLVQEAQELDGNHAMAVEEHQGEVIERY